MERDIAISLLLLIGLTWLLYKLTVLLEPDAQKNANSAPRPETAANGAGTPQGVRDSTQKPIHQRLRK